MRIFYEAWESVLNRQPLADDLVLDEKLLLVEIRQPLADEFNWSDFLSIGFSHHTEIISKAKTLEARLFYIHECATRYWSKYTLRDYLKQTCTAIGALFLTISHKHCLIPSKL